MKISVITPFYNGNGYIKDLIQNISENTRNLKKVFSNYSVELIIVNDSPDVKVDIPFEISDLEYRVLSHEKNSGIHQARVTGLLNCSGDYILFLDQDDLVSDHFLVEQLPYMNMYDVVVSNANLENMEGKLIPLYRTKGDYIKMLNVESYIYSHNQIVSPGQCLIKKSAIPEEWCHYIMKKNGSDDLFLWMLMFNNNVRFGVNKKCLYTHRYTGVNLSASASKMGASSIEFADYMRQIEYIPKSIIDPFVRAREFPDSLHNKSWIGMIIDCIKNLDIIIIRVKWKIKCRFSAVERG